MKNKWSPLIILAVGVAALWWFATRSAPTTTPTLEWATGNTYEMLNGGIVTIADGYLNVHEPGYAARRYPIGTLPSSHTLASGGTITVTSEYISVQLPGYREMHYR